MFKYYDENKIGIDYVVGDIHGCYSDLEKELLEINFDKTKDRLFSVGDLTDRGPESHRALEFLKYDWFIPVIGNHEDIILQCYDSKTAEPYWHHQNGGAWWSHFDNKSEYISLIKELPLVIQVGDYGILHSMVPSGIDWEYVKNIPEDEKGSIDYIMWQRTDEILNPVTGIKKIYAGHTIRENPFLNGNILDIDTGAFLQYWSNRKGKLTILKIKED